MKHIFKQVRPQDFNVEALMNAAREGRLYIDVKEKEPDQSHVAEEVRAYVAPIQDYVSPEFFSKINQLWSEILASDRIREYLTMKKGTKSGHMNRYAVTNLVCFLRNKGVYRQEVSALDLHLRMEKTDRRNKYYMSNGNYYMSDAVRIGINKLLRGV
ncbi:MAG: hypothetical protein IJP70_02350 [Bacteroidales bacterium]|nr:hypothetical protein [Bacteroidales bacterium]